MKPELFKQIWNDTCAFIGRHYVLALVIILLLNFLAFGVEGIIATVLTGLAFSAVMYAMPDDHNGPRGA